MAPFPRRRLDESFLDSEVYNTLPHIDLEKVYDQEKEQSSVRQALLKVITDHGYDDQFSIHLLHRHYDAPPNHVMVYEQSPESKPLGLPFIEVCSPRSIDEMSTNIRGKFFFYRPDTAAMSAYEYTTEAGPDLTPEAYDNFIEEFTQKLVALNMERVFALSVLSPLDRTRTLQEIEIPQYKATLRVEASVWESDGFTTDWFNLPTKGEGIRSRAGFREASNGASHAVSKKNAHTRLSIIDPGAGSAGLGIFRDEEELNRESMGYRVIAKARGLIVS